VYSSVSGRKYNRTNIVAAQCCGKIIAPMEYSGSTDHYIFEMWFKEEFLTQLPTGRTIVMDNAPFHRKKVLTELAMKFENELLFLPAYSPDLNPIEKTWANLKTFLHNYAYQFEQFKDAITNYFKVE
jgi:transposase